MSSLLIIGSLLFCLNDAYLRMIKQYDNLFEAIKIIYIFYLKMYIRLIKKNELYKKVWEIEATISFV